TSLRPMGVGLLYADVEAVELKGLDEVGACLLVGGAAGRAAADGASQPLDVGPRILPVEAPLAQTAACDCGERRHHPQHAEPEPQQRFVEGRHPRVTHAGESSRTVTGDRLPLTVYPVTVCQAAVDDGPRTIPHAAE